MQNQQSIINSISILGSKIMFDILTLTHLLKITTWIHYDDVIMGAIASQITSLTIVYSTVYSGADQSKHQSSASLAFVRGIHRGPVNSPHKWPVTRKMFPFDDVIMRITCRLGCDYSSLLSLNSSPPGQNGSHFAGDIFRWIFMIENFCYLIKISPTFVPKGPIYNIFALV